MARRARATAQMTVDLGDRIEVDFLEIAEAKLAGGSGR